MAFDGGAVSVRVGADYDDHGFDRFFKRIRQARQEKDVTTNLRMDADTRGADRYHRAIKDVNDGHERTIKSTGRMRTGFGALWGTGGAAFAAAGGAYALAKGVTAVVSAYRDSEKQAAQTNAVIKSTGGVAGVSSGHVDKLTASIMKKTAVDDDAIRSGANLLLTFTNVRNEVGKGNNIFDQATSTIVDMSAALGQDMKSSSIQLGKALNDPIKGVTALQRVGVSFTASQKEQIKSLVDSGKTLDAQKIILRELNKEFGGSAAAVATPWDRLKTSLGNLAETIGKPVAGAIDTVSTSLSGFIDNLNSGTGSAGSFASGLRSVFDKTFGFIGSILDDNSEAIDGIGDALAQVWSSVQKTGAGIVRTFKQTFGDESGIGADIRSIMAVLFDLVEEIAGVAARIWQYLGPPLEKVFAGVFQIIRGAIRIIAGILTLDFGKAWDGVKDIFSGGIKLAIGVLGAAVAPLRGAASKLWDGIGAGVTGAWNGVKRIASAGLSFVLGGFTSALDVMADAMDKVPSAVRKLIPGFNDTRKSIRDTQVSVDKYRDSLKDSRTEQEKHPAKLKATRDEVNRLKGRLGDLKEGTDEYRTTAEKLRKKQQQLNDEIKKSKEAKKVAAQAFVTIAGNAAGLAAVVSNSMDSIGSNVNEVLKELGAKALRYTIKKPKDAGATIGGIVGALGTLSRQHGGGIPKFMDGGWLGSRGQKGEDSIPVLAAPGEFFATNHMVPYLEAGLMNTFGIDLDGLASTVNQAHRYQRGGSVTTRANALDRMQLPYVWGGHHGETGPIRDPRPGLDCSSAVSYVLGIPPRVSGDFMNFGKPGPGPITLFANPDHIFMSILGRGFGTSAENPGGGAGWLSYNSRPGFVVRHVSGDLSGAASSITAPVVIGPNSILRTIGNAAGRKVAGAANSYINTQMGGLDFAGGQPLAEGGLPKSGLMKLWRSVGGAAAAANTAGAVAMAESRGQQYAQHTNSDGSIDRGFWQINSVHGPLSTFDARGNASAAKQISGNGRNWNPWTTYKSGAFRSFLQRGGKLLKRQRGGGITDTNAMIAPGVRSSIGSGLSIRALRRTTGSGIKRYDVLSGRLDDERKKYDQTDRKYNQSDEVFINEETGELNTEAIEKRAGELDRLLKIRQRIKGILQNMLTVAKRVVNTYKTIIRRLTRSLRHAKKKDRSGIRDQIKHYRDNMAEWQGNTHDLPFDITDAKLDITDIHNEGAELRGLRPEARDTDTGGDTGADTGGDTGGDTTTTPTAPTAEDIARGVAAELASFNQGRSDLFAQFGNNFYVPGTLAGDALVSAAGPRYFGAVGADGQSPVAQAGGGGIVFAPRFDAPPPDPHTWAQQAAYELKTIG